MDQASLRELLTRAMKSITIAWFCGEVSGPFYLLVGTTSSAQSQVVIWHFSSSNQLFNGESSVTLGAKFKVVDRDVNFILLMVEGIDVRLFLSRSSIYLDT